MSKTFSPHRHARRHRLSSTQRQKARPRWLNFETLENRQLLAATVIEIRAAGATGQEQMQLQIAGQPVATFSNIGGNYNAGQFQTFSYTHPTDVSISQVRVVFTNNGSTSTGGDKNLRVDAVTLNGVRHETEAPTVFTTGTFVPGVGRGIGRLQSEFMHYDGYFQYGAAGTIIEVRAAGNTHEEQMQIQIGGAPVATFNNIGGNYASRVFQSYVYVHPTQVPLNQVRVAFTNNATTAAGDRNLRVDSVSLDAVSHQAEDPSVLVSGTFIPDVGLGVGRLQTEFLHYSGYFQFGATGTVIEIRAAGNTHEEQMQLQIGGAPVATFNNIGGNFANRQFANHYYVHPTQVSLSQVRVAFTNNATTAAGDRNLKVDGLWFDGVFQQTEAPDVLSTGTWMPEFGGSVPGLWQNENLHTTGHFQFASGAVPGSLALGNTLFSVDEDGGAITIPVTRTGGSDGTVGIRYTTVNASATAGNDFTATSGLVIFGPGETSKNIVVPILNDSVDEDDEAFSVAIDQALGGAVAGVPRTGTVTIHDDDGPQPPGNGNGLLGIYFEDMALSTAVHEQTDATVNFNWGGGAPNSFVGQDFFSVRWVGEIEPRFTETYTFRTTSDDGVRLWINGQLIIDQWNDHATTDHFGAISLVAGQRYELIMEHYEKTGQAVAVLAWSSPSQPIQVVPQSQLYSEPPSPPHTDVFSGQQVVSGLNGPTAIAFDSTGRMFIAEQRGVVRVYANGQLLPASFVDIRSQVNHFHDRGMLGVAVHPQFPTVPYVYVSYTYDPPQTANNTGKAGPDGGGNRVARVTRFTADASTGFNTAVAGSEVVIIGTNSLWENISHPELDSTDDITIPPSGAPNGEMRDILIADSLSHTIGNLAFGPDGMLYAANGDGTSFGRVDPRTSRVQSLDSLSGKILRVDPLTGQGLPDNPFYNGDPSSNRSKVYNYGLRNPFRFAIEPITGQMYVGDVGWATWEEINRGRGENFGWPYYEGGNGTSQQTGGYSDLPEAQAFYASNPDVEAPLWARMHSAGAVAVVAGDFYTGNLYPADYQNALFISDIGDNRIRVLRLNEDGSLNGVEALNLNVGFVVEMTMGRDGYLYYADIASGVVGRFVYSPSAPLVSAPDPNAIFGDFDRDGDTDGADFLSWQRGLGADGRESSDELAAWHANFGHVTPPPTLEEELDESPFVASLAAAPGSVPTGAVFAKNQTFLETLPAIPAPTGGGGSSSPWASAGQADGGDGEDDAADEAFATLDDDPLAWVESL